MQAKKKITIFGITFLTTGVIAILLALKLIFGTPGVLLASGLLIFLAGAVGIIIGLSE